MDDNIFEDYYKTFFVPEQGKEPARAKDKSVTEDAKLIKVYINDFIGKMNKLIGGVFEEQKKKETRPDLIVTLVVGGLAFTMANVYFLVTRDIGATISKEDFQRTFLGMYESALNDMGKHEGKWIL